MNTITKDTLKKCEAINDSSEECILEKSKDNKNVFKINKNDKLIYLGSKYNVKREIEKSMKEKSQINTETVIVVFGLAAGEHILELLQYTDKNKIIIVEPNLNVIKEFMKLEYSEKILNEERVIVYNYEKEFVNEFLKSSIGRVEARNFQYILFANYASVYNEEYIYFSEQLKIFIVNTKIGFNTTIFFSNEFIKNYMRNLPYIIKGKRINDFKDKFKGYPAVIVSAGPSLEKNIEFLKDSQDKMIIITGGRTLGPLLKRGIKPDFICVVDPAIEAYQIMENDLDNDIPMVFCEYTYSDVINEYSGKKVYFPHDSVKEITKELIKVNTDSLLVGGSVAHTCTGYGVYMGCDPIIFIGQDCAYTNDKHHADLADTLEGEEIGNYDLYVDDIYGDKVGTSYILNSFRTTMEKNIKIFKDNTFINSTEGGANIEGTEVMPLKESIKKYCVKTINKDLMEVFSKPVDIDNESVIDNLDSIMKILEDVKRHCKIGVRESKKLLNYYAIGKKVNLDSILKKLDDVDANITKARQILILEALIAPVIIDVLSSVEFVEKFNESEKEAGVRVSKRSGRLYDGLLKAIQIGEPLIKECIQNI